MSDNCSYHDIVELLNRHNQQHLLAFYEELCDTDRQRLRSQISQFDFSAIPDWVRNKILFRIFAETIRGRTLENSFEFAGKKNRIVSGGINRLP